MCFHIENNIHLSPILHEVFPLDSYEEQSLCKHKGLYNCWACCHAGEIPGYTKWHGKERLRPILVIHGVVRGLAELCLSASQK